MSTTILMGSEPLAQRLALTGKPTDEVLLAADADAVCDSVRAALPELVVVDTATLAGDIRQFLQKLLSQRNDFRAPVYLVDTRGPEPRVGVCEWSPKERAYRAAESTLEQLIEAVGMIGESGARATSRAKNVGYYDYVDNGGRKFHVQTEVIPQRDPIVQTTVLQGGAVLDVISSKVEAGGGIDLRSDEAAREQHRAALERVGEGRYS